MTPLIERLENLVLGYKISIEIDRAVMEKLQPVVVSFENSQLGAVTYDIDICLCREYFVSQDDVNRLMADLSTIQEAIDILKEKDDGN